MHVPYQDDPPPDAPEYDRVHCEHGGLSLNVTGRRRISVQVGLNLLILPQLMIPLHQACKILTALFPQWKPVMANEGQRGSLCRLQS